MVATIFLLAMTVTLFAGIFLFTNQNRGASTEPLNEFSSSVSYGGLTGLQVISVSITHLAGATLYGTAASQVGIYIVSQNHPAAIPNPMSLPAGLQGSSTWSFGQTWKLALSSYGIVSPDNLTISVVANGVLQYRSTLFALVPTVPPQFLQVRVTPSAVAPGATYSLSALVEFTPPAGNTVLVNLTEIRGLATQPMVLNVVSGFYTYSAPLLSTVPAGTFYVFLTATDGAGVHTVYALPFIVT